MKDDLPPEEKPVAETPLAQPALSDLQNRGQFLYVLKSRKFLLAPCRATPVRSVVEVATAAAMDALPQRLSVREMAAAAGVSLGSLQRAYAEASRLTPVAHVQHLCLQAARRELETGALGATVFAIARRWGFTSSDGAFRDGYWATYRERPSDTFSPLHSRRTSGR